MNLENIMLNEKKLDTNGHMFYVPGTLLAGEHIKMLWFLQEAKVKRKGQQWETLFQTDFQELRLQHPQNLEFSTLSASASRQEKKDHVRNCAPSCPYHSLVISNYSRTWEVRVSLNAPEETVSQSLPQGERQTWEKTVIKRCVNGS